ncbi:hypothetical protein AGRA3207_004822 [Actinomadura graeca]|uniref:Uncharacterized protein n=1 Tax=Actinomadura graeca TaxID=2750812 RepID=A0ABX8QXR6_9ACTN|nr:hypothetical protein [Actinomadura graeca]QXJ23639.1 hypothetical protein AGRA3207_004822 [Actinomadura graeca]
MAAGGKDRPVPPGPDDAVRTALVRAAEGQVDEELTITLRIAGGLPSQAYRFDFRIGGDLRARAAVQETPPRPEHERAAEAIYELAGRLMDAPPPRP